MRQAQQLNHPCRVREEPAHRGKLPTSYSLAEIPAGNVILEVIKPQEDGKGLILRGYETHGQSTTAPLRYADEEVAKVTFSPYEIKTLWLYEGKLTEVDLLERPTEA